MKKNKLFLVPLMAATLSLGSCSSDSPDMGGSDNTFKGDQAFMKVRIAMANDPGTRSVSGTYGNGNEFQYGTGDEQKIQTLGFKFYKSDGSFYSYGKSQGSINTTPNGTNSATTDNIDAIGDAVISIEVKEGDEKPAYVVAYVNCGDDNWKQTPEPSLDVITKTITSFGSINDGYAMTSSNYISNGYQQSVDPGKFFETEEAAKLDNTPVDIFVERIAAKVTVENTPPTVTEVEKSGYRLTFEVKGFTLGGTNKQSYLIKNLDPNWTTTTNPWNGWQPAGLNRCYWGMDMNYTYVDPGKDKAGNDILNYSYYNAAVTCGTYLYCHENTFAATDDVSINPYLVQPFVYVTGIYKVLDNTGKEVDKNLFYYAGNFFLEDAMIDKMQDAAGGVLFSKNGNKYDKVDLKTANLVEIVAADANNAILQLKATKGENGKVTYPDLTTYYVKDESSTDGFRSATAADAETINSQLSSAIKVNGFKYDGTAGGHLAYFPVLIEHLNFQNGTDGTIVPREEQPVGAYGIVRNHIYSLTINTIKNLGIGVFNPDQIIIPDNTTKTYYLGARIKILSWKVVKQGVDL